MVPGHLPSPYRAFRSPATTYDTYRRQETAAVIEEGRRETHVHRGPSRHAAGGRLEAVCGCGCGCWCGCGVWVWAWAWVWVFELRGVHKSASTWSTTSFYSWIRNQRSAPPAHEEGTAHTVMQSCELEKHFHIERVCNNSFVSLARCTRHGERPRWWPSEAHQTSVCSESRLRFHFKLCNAQ
jgi:hypothetical protein